MYMGRKLWWELGEVKWSLEMDGIMGGTLGGKRGKWRLHVWEILGLLTWKSELAKLVRQAAGAGVMGTISFSADIWFLVLPTPRPFSFLTLFPLPHAPLSLTIRLVFQVIF